MTHYPTYVPFSENDQRTHEAILIAETRQISLLLFRLAGRAIEALSRGLDEAVDMDRVRTLSALMSRAIWAHDLMERRIHAMMGREEKRKRLEAFEARKAARRGEIPTANPIPRTARERRSGVSVEPLDGESGSEYFAEDPGSARRHDMPALARELGGWEGFEPAPAPCPTPIPRTARERGSGVSLETLEDLDNTEHLTDAPDREDWAGAVEAAVAAHDHGAIRALTDSIISPLMAELDQLETRRAGRNDHARDPTA